MAALREQATLSGMALELTILTAARTGEVLGARWDEINLREQVWVVPADRMKAHREHRVPLSDPAIALLERLQIARQGDFIFPGRKSGRPLTGMVLFDVLRRMGRSDLTVHGFRSSFRDWAAERTNFPSELAEMALAHAVGSRVEAAYRRSDLFEKRRRLMDEWATYCEQPSTEHADNVVELRGASQIPA
jgi:integrase